MMLYINSHYITLQGKVETSHITDLDELQQWLRTKWVKLDHIIIVAVVSSPISMHQGWWWGHFE